MTNNKSLGGTRLASRQLASEVGSSLQLSIKTQEVRHHPDLTEGQVRFKLGLRAYRTIHLGVSQKEFGILMGLTENSATTVVPRWESLSSSRLPSGKIVRELRRRLLGGVPENV
ncbi:hypothetical protein LCGC14_2907920 [marine sediment metagenome]|uniref:Uncharacterized protein n=1 Tax=marine sediment metagenome TaxID=412755 RepID=A0A0F8XSH7_9ZZZZ